jgi:hypothetical protein
VGSASTKDSMVTIGARMKLVVTAFTISEKVKTYSHCASDKLGGSTAGGDQGSSGLTSDHITAMNNGHRRPDHQQRDDEQRDESPEAEALAARDGERHHVRGHRPIPSMTRAARA